MFEARTELTLIGGEILALTECGEGRAIKVACHFLMAPRELGCICAWLEKPFSMSIASLTSTVVFRE